MTDTTPIAALVRKPAPRNPSAKTLARQLAKYLNENKISSTITVGDLMRLIKNSIVTEEVGVSLDVWES